MKKIDAVGQIFGRLRVVEMARKGGHAACVCVCTCGNVKSVRWSSLKVGFTGSCGCLQKELMAQRNYKHGDAVRGRITAERLCFHMMHQRCENPNRKSYADYGKRGIKVCARWSGPQGYANFLADIGRKPAAHYQVDRYPDNDGNYEPGNVRWATPKENSNNRRPARKRRRVEKEEEQHAAA